MGEDNADTSPAASSASAFSRALFAIFGNAAAAPEIRRALVETIAASVREFLVTAPPIPLDALTSASAFRTHILTRCGIVGFDASLDDEVIDRLTQEIVEHYRSRAEIQARSSLRVTSRTVDPPLTALPDVQQQLGLDALSYLASVGGGLSGAAVVKVYFREAAHEAIGILKLTSDSDDHDRERRGHEEATVSWLRHWVSPPPRACTCDSEPSRRRYALLSLLAFPPDSRGDESDCLHIAVGRSERGRVAGVVRELGQSYSAHLHPAERRQLTPRDFVRELLQHWTPSGKEGVWEDAGFWSLPRLPSPNVESFIDGEAVLLNPLWLLQHFEGLAPDNRTFLYSFQHGDLNARNILLARTTETAAAKIQLIDFEKAGVASSLLDVCWLSLWLIVASGDRVPGPTVAQWQSLPSAFVDAFVGGIQEDRDLGVLQLGVEMGRALIEPIRLVPLGFADLQTRGFWENRLHDQLRLTLGATALGMSFYECRQLHQMYESADGDSAGQRHTLWAIAFFRIAAIALRPYGPSAPRVRVAPNVVALIDRLAK